MSSIVIDGGKCSGCMLCVKVCMLNYEAGPDGKARVKAGDQMCFACGHCAAVCPAGAISHTAFNSSTLEPLDHSSRPGYEQFVAFLKLRRSRREFKEQPVPREVIDKLLAAAVLAPNGLNRQNVEYTVITNRGVLDELSRRITEQMAQMMGMLRKPVGGFILKAAMGRAYRDMEPFIPLMDQIAKLQESGLDMVLYNAPCAVLVHTEKGDMCGAEDSVYAAADIQYAAETLGLGTCVIGFVTEPVNRDPRLKKLVGLPNGHKVQTTLIVGYPQFAYTSTAPRPTAKVRFVD